MSSSKAQAAKELFSKLSLKAKQVVLNLSEVAVKTQEATNNDKWGPHGQLLNDIAEGSYDAEKFKEVWEVLRKRMVDGVGEKWRLTYKSLLVIEFLVKQSSQHVVQVILENVGVIQELQKFQYKDEAGKDWGLNVRNRAKELCALLGNPDCIREERAKAKANKEKYKGLSKAATLGNSVDDAEGSAMRRAGPQGYGGGSSGSIRDFEGTEHGQGRSMLQQGAEEEEEDPVVATGKRIDSLKQSGAMTREEGPVPAYNRGPAVPVPAVVESFEAFPSEQPVAVAAKPSLRALSETKKGAPKKLGDVRVDPSIAASFGSLKIASPTSVPAASQACPTVDKQVFGHPAVPAPQAPTAAPTASVFGAFGDFGSPAAATVPSPTPPMAAAPALEDPFAVLSADRKPPSLAQQILGSPPAIKPAVLGNPFGSPGTINLTATTVPAPLPEAMFSAPTGPVLGAGYGVLPTVQGSANSPAATLRTFVSSPAMKPSLKPQSPVAPAAAAFVDDPFSAFNPFSK